MNEKISSNEIHGKDILNAIRNRGTTITAWAKTRSLKRGVLYHAVNGGGSKDARIHLAVLLKHAPSEIWPNRSQNLKILDDFYYREFLDNQQHVENKVSDRKAEDTE